MRSPSRGWLRAPELVEQTAARDAEVFLLELHERRRRGVVVPRDLEAEAVGLVLLPARVSRGDRRDDEREHADEQHHERERGDVGELREAEPARKRAINPAWRRYAAYSVTRINPAKKKIDFTTWPRT